ncbi:uncharacterized protein LOC143362007 [Halictus rubicundus]|uniref:uncharacterized protein LOC143362007 n=1 Tax=Halictus rubicundus TaxID=77578 RepID=UPI0040356532
MERVDADLADQKRTAALIANFIANATKSEAAGRFKLAELDARLELLEAYWKAFLERDYVLQRIADQLKGRSYFKENVYDTTEEAYVVAKTWFREKLAPFQRATLNGPQGTPVPATRSSIQSSLEKLELPRFSGRQRHWVVFKERFTALVLEDRTIPLVVKLQHLLNCLDGEAAAKLKGIEIVGPNFLRAWETLCRSYDNKFLRFSIHMNALDNLPTSTRETSEHINMLLNTANESINTFRALDRPVQHWDDILVYFVESKLAPSTRLEWAKNIEHASNDFPKFAQLKVYLENKVRMLDLFDTESCKADGAL